MTLETSVDVLELPLEYPFTIARGTQDVARNVIVQIEDEEGTVGVGGAAPSGHYGESLDTVRAVLPTLLDIVERVGDPFEMERIEREMDATIADNPAAKAAVDIALHDLVARRVGEPLYRYWGLDPQQSISTSYTIGIAEPDEMERRAAEAVERGYEVLKIKLGTDRDFESLEAVRAGAPEATIRVDANEAWTPKQAVRRIQAIQEFDIEFVEQPVPAEHPEGLAYVTAHSPLPIAVDESVIRATDVPAVADRADIVNLKLMKSGGLREARRIIDAAHAHGLEVMAGCMIESNASIAAAAHLAPLLDHADLDGSLLLESDPIDGVPMPDGHIDLASLSRPGTGADW